MFIQNLGVICASDSSVHKKNRRHWYKCLTSTVNNNGLTSPDCQAVSVWTVNRHGNRNPGTSVTAGMREMALIKDDIVRSYYAGNSQLCAQVTTTGLIVPSLSYTFTYRVD